MLQTLQMKMIECTDKKIFLNKIIMLFSHLFNSLKILSSHVYYFFISVIEQAWKKKGYLAR